MLIINRKIGEEIVLTDETSGNVVNIKVKDKQGAYVSFVIDAPKTVKVGRIERKKYAGNQQATGETRFDEGINDEPRTTTS